MAVGWLRGVGQHRRGGTDRAATGSGAWASISGTPTPAGRPEVKGEKDTGEVAGGRAWAEAAAAQGGGSGVTSPPLKRAVSHNQDHYGVSLLK
jgi:hypothetical protein